MKNVQQNRQVNYYDHQELLEPNCTRIVGVIGSVEDARIARADPTLADVYEFRADRLCGNPEVETTIKCLREHNKQIILTVRDPLEGGHGSLSLARRTEIFWHYMPLADAIDVEAKNAIRLREIIEEAKKRGIKVIISGHFLESMPFLIDLVYIVSRYDSFSADILKVAVTIKHPADMRYITNWASSLMEDPLNKYRIAPMAVGRKYGKSSRLMFAKMGAALVYSSLATAVVEGQWNVREISRLLSNNN